MQQNTPLALNDVLFETEQSNQWNMLLVMFADDVIRRESGEILHQTHPICPHYKYDLKHCTWMTQFVAMLLLCQVYCLSDQQL